MASGLCPQTEVCAGPTKGWGVAWCQGTPSSSVESQVPCWTQAWLQGQETAVLEGPQVGITLCPLPGRKGASPQAPSPKPGEGDALMLKSSWTNFLKVSEATGRTRCFTLLWGEQAFFLQKK